MFITRQPTSAGSFPSGPSFPYRPAPALSRRLGIAALQGQHPHLVQGVPLGVAGNLRKPLDDVGLVVLHGDEHSLYLQNLLDLIDALQHVLPFSRASRWSEVT